MSIRLVLYHQDPYFVEVFSSYVSRSNKELELICFTNEVKADEHIFHNKDSIIAVIADADFLAKYTDVGFIRIATSYVTVTAENTGRLSLNIYQQGQNIISDIKKILTATTGENIFNARNSRTNIVSFFSTQGGSGKTSICYMTAIHAAKNFNVLYLNFELTPFISCLYETVPQSKMEDIIFAIKDKRNLPPIVLNAMLKNEHNVNVLPQIIHIQDLLDINRDDMERLINSIIELGDIDYIFVDLSSELSRINQYLLERSDRIILVYNDDANGKGKLNLLMNDTYIKNRLEDKIKTVRNKCMQKINDSNSTAIFPFSQSMSKGMKIYDVYCANNEFSKGCNNLLSSINQ